MKTADSSFRDYFVHGLSVMFFPLYQGLIVVIKADDYGGER